MPERTFTTTKEARTCLGTTKNTKHNAAHQKKSIVLHYDKLAKCTSASWTYFGQFRHGQMYFGIIRLVRCTSLGQMHFGTHTRKHSQEWIYSQYYWSPNRPPLNISLQSTQKEQVNSPDMRPLAHVNYLFKQNLMPTPYLHVDMPEEALKHRPNKE